MKIFLRNLKGFWIFIHSFIHSFIQSAFIHSGIISVLLVYHLFVLFYLYHDIVMYHLSILSSCIMTLLCFIFFVLFLYLDIIIYISSFYIICLYHDIVMYHVFILFFVSWHCLLCIMFYNIFASCFHTWLDVSYVVGISTMRRSRNGGELPSARLVSSTISEDRDLPHHIHTLMLMMWGQFIDHDLSLTAMSKTSVDPSGLW